MQIREAASLIRSSKHLTAFTGAGVSVESGIPPFRGPGGLWGKYDPHTLELDYFLADPARAWPVIREIFYNNFGQALPNDAHLSSSPRTSILCDEIDRKCSLTLYRTELRFSVAQNRERKTRAPKMFCAMVFSHVALYPFAFLRASEIVSMGSTSDKGRSTRETKPYLS